MPKLNTDSSKTHTENIPDEYWCKTSVLSTAHYYDGGHRNHACWNMRAELNLTSLALRDLILPLGGGHCSLRVGPALHGRGDPVLQRDGPAPHHGLRRIGSTPHLILAVSASQVDQIQGFELSQSNIYPIYDLPECMKGLVLGTIATWSSWLWAIAGYLKGVSGRVQNWWWTRSQRPWTRSTTHGNERLQVKPSSQNSLLHDILQLLVSPRWMKRC